MQPDKKLLFVLRCHFPLSFPFSVPFQSRFCFALPVWKMNFRLTRRRMDRPAIVKPWDICNTHSHIIRVCLVGEKVWILVP